MRYAVKGTMLCQLLCTAFSALLWTDVLLLRARCGEPLAKELESKMLAFADDLEFGLTDFASEALLTIESSPDSERWFEGTAKFVTFKVNELDFRKAEWHLSPLDGARSESLSSYFAVPECAVSKLRFRGTDYVNAIGIDRWMREDQHLSSCSVVMPTDWPMILPILFDNRFTRGETRIQENYRNSFCAKATQVSSRIVDSIWLGKVTTKEGNHLAFEEIRVEDDLPVLYTVYSYQQGFRDLAHLPSRKDCIRVTRVETIWTKFDDFSVPRKVKAELNSGGAGGVQDLKLTVDLMFSNSKTKEYETVKKVVDEAIQQVDALELAPKMKIK
jgi:hypothetical protein